MAPDATIRDQGTAAVPGFIARRRKGDAVTFSLIYRTTDGRQHRLTLGTASPAFTPDQARAAARDALKAVHDGHDPASDRRAHREAATVGDLCDAYLAAAEAGKLLQSRGTAKGKAKKPSTITTDRSRIAAHIRPLLGKLKVKSVTPTDVRRFMADVMDGKTATERKKLAHHPKASSRVTGGDGAAARTMGLLGAIFTFAIEQGHRPDNPVRGITRPADGVKNRRLTDAEYLALTKGLVAVSTPKARKDGKEGASMWPHAVAAARFLTLTGWRMGEALNLRWRDVDLTTRTVHLPDSKTGASMRPLSNAAADVLRGLEAGPADALVFPAEDTTKPLVGFPKQITRIVRAGELPADITAHVLRHSFASVAHDIGLSELTIAALIGHRGGSVTSKYVHAADAVLLKAADDVANSIMTRMGEAKPAAKVIALPSAA